MNIFIRPGIFSLAVLILSVSGCDPDEVTKTDPCKDKIPFTGNFFIYENVGDSLVETDSALQYNYITFQAEDDFDTYEWTIGTDPRVFTENKVSLLFTEAYGKIDVTLKSTKKKNECFPEDETEKVVTKSFYVINWQFAPIIGAYQGHFKSTPFKRDTVKILYIPGSDEFGSFRLININKGCMVNPQFPESSVWDIVHRGVRAFYFESRGEHYNGCKSPKVWLKLTDSDSIFSDFSYLNLDNQNPPYPRIYDRFKGKKIN
jgi:hypothetical protein